MPWFKVESALLSHRHCFMKESQIYENCFTHHSFWTLTVYDYYVGIPYLAAFKHARVHDVGTHKGCLHSFYLLRQQLVGQRLMEAHCSKLAGTVILPQRKSIHQSLFTLLLKMLNIHYLWFSSPALTASAVICILMCYLILGLCERTV